ncbi:prepilin peptidase [Brevundimonas sp. P7753]|jgi:prepilin peptidase CpaA|uniref:A24 family peptidase n=1 Tax=Brevundimonas TaxID=41275 RepID=UPI0015BC3EDE|nr:prepilin peptidase [Brevundimonas sp. P7753]MBD3833844.1 prepilin peptidase [Brevundimonas sp.]NWE52248.1 prepilin peptidase [Brevundimonas sp. P7753]
MTELSFALLGLMPVLVIVAGLHDLTTMKIPNWLSGLLILGFFPAALALGLPLSVVGVSVGAAVVALLIGAGMFALRWLGGGDAKLLAAVMLWLGLPGAMPFLLFTAMAGGGLCLVLILARAHLQVYAGNGPVWVSRLLEPKGDVPYGVAIAIGALLAYPASPLVRAFAGV